MKTTIFTAKYIPKGLIALFAIAAFSTAMPAFAGERPTSRASITPASMPHNLSDREARRWERNRYNNRRADRNRPHDERGYRNRNNRNGYYDRNQRRNPHARSRYSQKRIPHAWKKVRGRIINVGRGYNRGCFKVQRKGMYQGERAIVTVKYCENNYGKPVKQHGSKRLVRYLGYVGH